MCGEYVCVCECVMCVGEGGGRRGLITLECDVS